MIEKELVSHFVLQNYIGGEWLASAGQRSLEVANPATQEVLGRVVFSTPEEVDAAARAAAAALDGWRHTPAVDRVQYLFKMKRILEDHREELARLITLECGKTLAESTGEVQRAIENVEVACGIPTLMQGTISEDIAPGIDEMMIRQPVGVCVAICPFNFPAMIAFWFMPYALACGNTFIVKPSERVPLTLQRIFELFAALDLPKGVLNLVNGDRETVDALLDHPDIRAISFVGSTAVARYVYTRATANGKRAQCNGGAKNPIVILPDADPEMTTRIVADSAFGCAGQRCLAASLALLVGDARRVFSESLADAAAQRVTGNGLDPKVLMGPVITPQSRSRIEGAVTRGLGEGASLLVDGRNAHIPEFEAGNFIRPTILADVSPQSDVVSTEIFGPVLGLMYAATVDEAIRIVNASRYGNMACIFTRSGSDARKFRSEVMAGNVGVNIGVAAPMAFFPFSGWKESFFGDLHGQSMDAVDFFTQKKVVVERWPRQWTRTF